MASWPTLANRSMPEISTSIVTAVRQPTLGRGIKDRPIKVLAQFGFELFGETQAPSK